MNRKYLIFGTSISAGAWDSHGGWVRRVGRYLNGLTLEAKLADDYTLYNLSISGDTSRGILARFEQEACLRMYPGETKTVIFELGINDALQNVEDGRYEVPMEDYTRIVGELLEKAKELADRVILVGPPSVVDERLDPVPWLPETRYANTAISKYNSENENLTRQFKIDYIDMFSLFEQLGPENLMSSDGLHPNDVGHEVYTEQMLTLLGY